MPRRRIGGAMNPGRGTAPEMPWRVRTISWRSFLRKGRRRQSGSVDWNAGGDCSRAQADLSQGP